MTELWVDLRIVPRDGDQQKFVGSVVRPLIQELDARGIRYRTFHFLHEPDGFLFRIAAEEVILSTDILPALEVRLNAMPSEISEFHDASKREGRPYIGETGSYGTNGWRTMELLLESASRIALLVEQYPPEHGLPWHIERMTHCLWNSLGLGLLEEVNMGIEGVFQRAAVILGSMGRDPGALHGIREDLVRRLDAVLV